MKIVYLFYFAVFSFADTFIKRIKLCGCKSCEKYHCSKCLSGHCSPLSSNAILHIYLYLNFFISTDSLPESHK